jgi:signal transduction histidine kinase
MDDRERGRISGSDFPAPLALQDSLSQIEHDTLDKIRVKVLSGHSLNEILNAVFESFPDIMSFDRMALAFLEEEGKRVVCKFVKTKYTPIYLKEGYAVDLAATSLEKVLKSRKPRVISDLPLYQLLRKASEPTKLLLREGVRSSMITPLYAGEKPLGILYFNSFFPNAYQERELAILQGIRDTLGWSIERAFYTGRIEGALNSYRELLNFVSHEIKNPISSLITQGRMLEQGYLGEMKEDQKNIVVKMLDKAEYLLGLVRNYLDLSKIEGGQLKVNIKDDVDLLKDVVEEAVSISLPRIQEKKMAFDKIIMGTAYPLSIDPGLIKIAIINLIGNGISYGREGGRIDLEITFKNEGVVIGVKNEGEGFTEEQKAKLFRKFSRLETEKALGIKGTGLGLYITWWIIQEHQGWINAESVPQKYARFTFFLPKGK